MSVTIKITNCYVRGEDVESVEEIITEAIVEAPSSTDEAVLDEWWQDVVYPKTGTDESMGDVNAGYFAEIVAVPDGREELLGLEYEWV